MLLAAVFGFAQALYAYDFVAGAAQQAARYALVRGSACRSWAAACPASASDVEVYVRSIAPPGLDANAVTVTTTWTPDNHPGSTVMIEVQYTFGQGMPFLPAKGIPLVSDAQASISQ